MTVEEWLIDAIKIRPIIWNTKDENYKNVKLKNAAYEEIAKDSNLTVNEIKRKWHSIRSAFSRELRMRNLYSNVSGNSANNSNNGEKRVWKHFNKLVFLQEDGLSSESELNELDGNMDNTEYTIAIISEDNLINNTIEYNHSSSSIQNTTSSIATNSSTTNSNHNNDNHNNSKQSANKKRKTTNQNSSPSSQFNSHQNNNNNNYHSKFSSLSEEEIFGHSIAASLRKFDPKKREIVKLRLQEVIVKHLSED